MIEIFYNLIAQTSESAAEQFGGRTAATIDEAAGQYLGAVSNLMAAVLQTAGLYAQSDILLNYRPMVESFATLVYIVAVIGAIFSVAVYGNYRQAAYLFIGPVIFYWLIYTTAPAPLTMPRTGFRIGTANAQNTALFNDIVASLTANSSATESGDVPRVSWFFAKFDSIVTEVVQNVVALLIDEEFNQDLNIAATERIYSRVLASQSESPALIDLVSQGVIGQCAENNRLNIEISSLAGKTEQASVAKFNILKNRYAKIKDQRKPISSEILQYISSTEYKDSFFNICGGGAKPLIENLKNSPDSRNTTISCSEVWSLTCLSALNEADIALSKINEADQGDSSISGEESEGVDWAVVKKRVESSLTNFKKSELPEEGALVPDGESTFIATQLLAAHIIKNTMSNTANFQLANKISGNNKFIAERFDHVFGTNENYEYEDLSTVDAQGHRASIVHFAAWVPYIQGFLLYLLSISFPFFTVFVLMPDRWNAIFVWMSLWIWVKCWDIGFAVVFFARNFLWDYMQSGVGLPGDSEKLDWSSQASVYHVMYSNDPMANTNTYYSIISLFTLSVPLITAHFCAGAPMLYRAFKTAIDEPSAQIGERQTAALRLVASHSIEGGDPTRGHAEEMMHALKAVKLGSVGKDLKGNDFTGDRKKAYEDAKDNSDASLSRFLRGVANEALIDFRFGSGSDRFRSIREANARATGRNDPYLHSTADNALAARTSMVMNNFYGKNLDGSEAVSFTSQSHATNMPVGQISNSGNNTGN